ncbi:MAG: hypothetical protein MJA29_02130, partial [Candidatus Omnitrophica bacterium]|nr:hypothetical protein [Candidatus Omnitrophota bacterium]
DLLLLSNKSKELQSMMSTSHQHSNINMYELHPVKSVVCPHRQSLMASQVEQSWLLGEKPVTVADNFIHLGLQWQAKKLAPDISSKIMLARRTAYALMGVGMHGQNGLDPSSSGRVYETYVVPRLLYGLEAVILRSAQLSELEVFHRKLTRQIQGLPQNTANSAVYLLLGTLPVEATLHLKQLSLFGAISRLEKEHPLWRIALRQLAIKSPTSKSWFARIADLSSLYDLDVHKLLQHPWPKQNWKEYVSETIKGHWYGNLKADASTKSTLKWLLLDNCWVGKPHPIWQACRGKQHLVEAATSRARLLVGRSRLSADRARYEKSSDPSCPFCKADYEDAAHFLVVCPAFIKTRTPMIQSLCQLYREENLFPPKTTTEMCSAILNGWGYSRDLSICDRKQTEIHTLTLNGSYTLIKLNLNIIPANTLCSSICHKLLIERDYKLDDLSETRFPETTGGDH